LGGGGGAGSEARLEGDRVKTGHGDYPLVRRRLIFKKSRERTLKNREGVIYGGGDQLHCRKPPPPASSD